MAPVSPRYGPPWCRLMKKTGAGESMTRPATHRLISSTLLEMRRERYLHSVSVSSVPLPAHH